MAIVIDLQGAEAGLHRDQAESVSVNADVAFAQCPLHQVDVLTATRLEVGFVKFPADWAREELQKVLAEEIETPLAFRSSLRMNAQAGQRFRELVTLLRRIHCVGSEIDQNARGIQALGSELLVLL